MRMPVKYLLLFTCLQACNPEDHQQEENLPALFSEPVIISLDTLKGYNINLLSGDTIRPIVNLNGANSITGVSIPFTGQQVIAKASPVTRKMINAPAIDIKGNSSPLPANLTSMQVDTSLLKKVKAGEYTFKNVVGRKMAFKEPRKVKALPLRFKDAATANVQYLDVDQGMSSSFIYVVLEDKRGDLWFGTDGTGVCKYDGLHFTNYTVTEGMSDNIVISMLEDSKGNLWFGTYKGITSYDGKQFTRYTANEGLVDEKILCITEDKTGSIWFSTEGKGLICYNGKKFNRYSVNEGMPDSVVLSSVADRNGNIWMGTAHGIAKFDGGSFTWYTKKEGVPDGRINAIHEDKHGNIWFGSGHGLGKLYNNRLTYFRENDGLSANSVWSIMNDKKGNLWLGTTYGGISRFDGRNFTHYNLAEGLSNNKVRSMMEDSKGNIWFGTDGGGVNRLNNDGFNYLASNEVMTNHRIRPIIKTFNGNIWLGTEGAGIAKYETATSQVTTEKITYYNITDEWNYRGQRSILQDKAGNIWIASNNNGVGKISGNNWIAYSLDQGLSDLSVISMLEDKNSNIWFGTGSSGIDKFDGKNFTHYSPKDGLAANKILSMLEDKAGNIWFCTEGGGLTKFDGTNIINFTEKEGLFSKSVTSMIEDSQGGFWLGTIGSGLCYFDGQQFTYYGEKQGLSNNNVWSLLQDPAGCIWAGTDKGLNHIVSHIKDNAISKRKYNIYSYGLQDGIKGLDFNLHSACLINDDRIWWGTGKNIVTRDFRTDGGTAIPALKLSFLNVNDRFYDFHNLPDSIQHIIKFKDIPAFSNCPVGLELAHDQNHLTFHFAATDWAAPHKLKYSYRMIGQDATWSRATNEPVADYRNLDHGRYEFQVRAVGRSQVWTDTVSYPFIIQPAWWQTWWFKTLLIIAGLILLFYVARFIYYYQLRKERAALEKQLAVQYERQRISAEMHDDIGAGLSGIRLLTEITKNKIKDDQAAGEIEKIYSSVGEISSKMKEVIWSLNTENDSLANLLSYLQKQARQMMENYAASFTITMPDQVPDIKINGETRRHIYLAVKESLHNIIKHSGADKVNLTISCEDSLLIKISDNGRGIDVSQTSNTGNGLKNMKTRMEKIGGRFAVETKEGLTLFFEIPLKPAT